MALDKIVIKGSQGTQFEKYRFRASPGPIYRLYRAFRIRQVVFGL